MTVTTGALGRARSRSGTVAGLVILLAVAMVAFLAWWNHFRVGLFGQYNAGYDSVTPALNSSTDQRIAMCDTALRAAFPELSKPRRVGGMTDQMRAFDAGCHTKALGYPSNPWVLHKQLAPEHD